MTPFLGVRVQVSGFRKTELIPSEVKQKRGNLTPGVFYYPILLRRINIKVWTYIDA